MPKGVYDKWNLQPETRKIFDQSSTGTLPTIRETPNSIRQGNVWNSLHFAYNQAVGELGKSFIESNNLRPDAADMTPSQARTLLKQIRDSEDPRIRDFNFNIRRIQRFMRLRGGSDDD